ncbi:hypothetical protein [Microbulbifer sp. 2205BS26-8]|uniref:hypothetical protein n=1 Tax=Microbulbifer sp. 2205BS26-8 TaxID=3064386 RepID=UPI00273F2DDE|nr:hypothetical protein [Microbulbifer sp. 2205BS26-8]MDP5210234.1 hypothetical protein [Microbulbifer sp. 2205BS26-8]
MNSNLGKSIAVLAKKFGDLEITERGDKEEPWTLAGDLVDVEKSLLVLSNDLFPQLLRDGASSQELKETLLDIGEEFRHIAYHIGNSKFYQYLRVTTPEHQVD